MEENGRVTPIRKDTNESEKRPPFFFFVGIVIASLITLALALALLGLVVGGVIRVWEWAV